MIFSYSCQKSAVNPRQLFLAAECPCGTVGFMPDGTAVVPHDSLEEFQVIEALTILGADCCSCFHELQRLQNEFAARISRPIADVFRFFGRPQVWDAVDRSARRFWDAWFPGSLPQFKKLLRDLFFGHRRSREFNEGFAAESCRMLGEITGTDWRIQIDDDDGYFGRPRVVYTRSPRRRSVLVSFWLPDLARSRDDQNFYVLWRREFASTAARICDSDCCHEEDVV